MVMESIEEHIIGNTNRLTPGVFLFFLIVEQSFGLPSGHSRQLNANYKTSHKAQTSIRIKKHQPNFAKTAIIIISKSMHPYFEQRTLLLFMPVNSMYY